jgi:hypothetical protein
MQEQRRYQRVNFFCPLHLTALQSGITVPGRCFDISIGGVGMTTGISLERGQMVRVRFHLHSDAGKVLDEDILGRVAYCQAQDEGNRLGIEFLDVVHESTQPLLNRTINQL